MQAIPQPSGWPDLGFGWGHPKSRKFLPVSARARNAMSVSTGAGFRLRIASIRHMSAQLVPNLPEERDPLRAVFRGLEAFGPLPVDDTEDAPAPPRGRDDDVDGIRGRGVDGHDLGHVTKRAQDIDRVSVFHEDDEEVARPDRERVFRGERLQAFIVPLDADETRPGRLAERHAELDPGYGPDERFVDVLRRLDEVRLAEDHVQPARVLDRDEFRLDRHHQCIGPRELSLLLAEVEVRYLHAEGTGIGIASESHGGNQGVVDDPGSVGDPAEREDLALVATAIQVHFASRVARERSVVEFMAIRFRWPASRTRRRLGALVELGVLRMSRDLADNWTKVFEVVDRPHVPAAIALELGA